MISLGSAYLNCINHVVIPLALFISRIIHKKTIYMDVDTANRTLQQYYKDSHGTCIRSTPKDSSDYEYDISIIIPCYKCENTIIKCLDSCISQKTSANFKIIAVDDGSPDSTGRILGEYAKNCDKLLVIHQENSGAGEARNSALNKAKSKYVTFVDADDFLPDGAIENLFLTAEQEQAYIVQGSFHAVNSRGQRYITKKSKTGILNPLEDLTGYPWGKLFRSECFSLVEFPGKYKYEDSINRMIIYEKVSTEKKKAYGIGQCVYCYWGLNPANVTNSDAGKPCSLDSFYIARALHDDRKKLGLDGNNSYYDFMLRMLLLSTKRIKKAPEEIRTAHFFAFRDFILKEFKGYKTDKSMKYTERAVTEGNYNMFCIVNMLTPS